MSKERGIAKKKKKTNTNIYLVYLERRGIVRTRNLRDILSLKMEKLFEKFLKFYQYFFF